LSIRRIRADERPHLCSIRLQALDETPIAFGSSSLRSGRFQTPPGTKRLLELPLAAIAQPFLPNATGAGSASLPVSLEIKALSHC
jgi:hypothetical protein